MNEPELVLGKVRKWSLPLFEGRPPTTAPRLKRLALPQGELAQVHDSEPVIRYLACVELRPGAVRGNHHHEVKEEFLYVIQGTAELRLKDLASGEQATLRLRPGDLTFIPVRIGHALRSLESGHAIEYSPAPFDAADVYPCDLL